VSVSGQGQRSVRVNELAGGQRAKDSEYPSDDE